MGCPCPTGTCIHTRNWVRCHPTHRTHVVFLSYGIMQREKWIQLLTEYSWKLSYCALMCHAHAPYVSFDTKRMACQLGLWLPPQAVDSQERRPYSVPALFSWPSWSNIHLLQSTATLQCNHERVWNDSTTTARPFAAGCYSRQYLSYLLSLQ